MDKKLLIILITGFIIEALCIANAFIGDIQKNIILFSSLYILSFIAYIFAIIYVLKITKYLDENKKNAKIILWTILAFSLVYRFTLLPMAPSDDMYRYLWEGKLQLNGINPYSHPPESPSLEQYRDEYYAGINHKHLTTIYPPVTLMAFAAADFISHSLISMKSFFLLFDILSIFLLIRYLKVMGRSPVNVLIYAWSPIILISFAARGHSDSLLMFFVLLALYLYSIKNNVKSIASIGLAAMSKFVFIIIAPFLFHKIKLKYLLALFSVIILLYLPYVNAGKGLFSTLLHFGTEYHFNDSVHFLILCSCFGNSTATKIVTILIFATVLIYLYKRYITTNPEDLSRSNENVLRSSFIAIGIFLMLTPTLHPWYLTWIVPFLCFNKNWAWIILTGTIVCYYFMGHALFSKMILYNDEWVWKEVHWLKLPEYLPFYGLLIYNFFTAKTQSTQRKIKNIPSFWKDSSIGILPKGRS